MRLRRWLSALVVLAVIAGVAYVGQQAEPAGAKMAAAAEEFLASLTPEQRAKATFAFDDPERFNWHFVPLEKGGKPLRKGLPFFEMNEEQKKAARALLEAGTSPEGYKKATAIISLEAILRDLEKGRGPVRDPEWYFVSIFGKPSKTDRWGWRIEGHHLSLNFVVDGGKVISSTPAFFGANPATVKTGPKKGLRALGEAEDLAKELFKSLDEDQRKVAYQAKQFPEVKAQNKAPEVGEPVGLAAARMTAKQRDLLLKLLQAYTNRMPTDVAAVELRKVKEAGIEQVHFAYAGGLEPGQPYTYRIQGPTFVVEFLNVQADAQNNPANHIHSCWRSLKGDFGLPAD